MIAELSARWIYKITEKRTRGHVIRQAGNTVAPDLRKAYGFRIPKGYILWKMESRLLVWQPVTGGDGMICKRRRWNGENLPEEKKRKSIAQKLVLLKKISSAAGQKKP